MCQLGSAALEDELPVFQSLVIPISAGLYSKKEGYPSAGQKTVIKTSPFHLSRMVIVVKGQMNHTGTEISQSTRGPEVSLGLSQVGHSWWWPLGKRRAGGGGSLFSSRVLIGMKVLMYC